MLHRTVHRPLLSSEDVRAQIGILQASMRQSLTATGTLGRAAEHCLSSTGKFFRARIALASCHALHVPVQQALGLARLCELLHQASLVHDDVQDGDTMRRNRASVWSKFGVNAAISAGDYLLALAFAEIADIVGSDSARISLLKLVSSRTADVIRGQLMHQELTDPWGVSIEEYDEIARQKTGPLLALGVEGALLLSGASEEHARRAKRALFWLGAAYQVRDDIFDFSQAYKGRTAGSDLRQGRLNAVILHFLALAQPAEKCALLTFLRKPWHSLDGVEVVGWVNKLTESDAFASTVLHVRILLERSRADRLDLPGDLPAVVREVAATLNSSVAKARLTWSDSGPNVDSAIPSNGFRPHLR